VRRARGRASRVDSSVLYALIVSEGRRWLELVSTMHQDRVTVGTLSQARSGLHARACELVHSTRDEHLIGRHSYGRWHST